MFKAHDPVGDTKKLAKKWKDLAQEKTAQKKMDGIADWRKRRNGRWSQKKKVKRKQIWNSQLGRNVNKKRK